MSEIKRMRSQLRRALEGEAWHGPSLKELLIDITAEQAVARPIPTAHSIWEIVLHISAWQRIALQRIKGEAKPEVLPEDNFPPVTDTSPEAWQQSLAELEATNVALRETLGQIDEAQLNDIVQGQSYSIYFLFHGVIQHDLYHAGQIALLKKMVGSQLPIIG